MHFHLTASLVSAGDLQPPGLSPAPLTSRCGDLATASAVDSRPGRHWGQKFPSQKHSDGAREPWRAVAPLPPRPPPRISTSSSHSHSKNHPAQVRTVYTLCKVKSSSPLPRRFSYSCSFMGILELPLCEDSSFPGTQERTNIPLTSLGLCPSSQINTHTRDLALDQQQPAREGLEWGGGRPDAKLSPFTSQQGPLGPTYLSVASLDSS